MHPSGARDYFRDSLGVCANIRGQVPDSEALCKLRTSLLGNFGHYLPVVGGGLNARGNGGQARFLFGQQGNWMPAMEEYADRQCSGCNQSRTEVIE